MDWKNQLTKTPYLILFVILISVGLTSAYAINITLGGTVDITEILNMVGNRITNVGSPTDGTDAATKEYVDQASSANILLPISDESSIIKCPRDMSQAGQWCIDNSVRSAAKIKDASLDCYDEGKIVTPLKALIACDYLNLSTSDCHDKTDSDGTVQLWTSDISHRDSGVSETFSDNVITYKGNNTINEVDSTDKLFEYFCSQQTLQHALHQHSTLRGDPVIVAVGDIACKSDSIHRDNPLRCHELQTSDLALSVNPDAIFLPGDLQYLDATLDDFLGGYDPTWGRMKSITYPSPGNHEYHTTNASGYYDYFGAAAGDPTKGYYSFDIGSWHIISLNSNCDENDPPPDNPVIGTADSSGIGSCAPQEQVDWLENDLAADDSKCTLAFWHHPRFTSGGNTGNHPSVGPFWDKLYADKADVVLVGHDHNYERFVPQDPNANPANDGMTQFVVGTGGWSLIKSNAALMATSAIYDESNYGILKLVLHDSSFDWEFIAEPGSQFTDQGTGLCN